MPKRLDNLRALLAEKNLAAWLQPMADAFQSEYVHPRDNRISFLSDFTGSAAFLIVTPEKAAFFTDGRYTLQAHQQLTGDYEIHDTADCRPSAWLAKSMKAGDRVGFDPWLHTEEQIRALKKIATAKGFTLIAAEENLVDQIWQDRPAVLTTPIKLHDISFAGKTTIDKRREVTAAFAETGIQATFLSDPTSVNWLLNIRGHDVAHTPLALCFALLHRDGGVDVFVDLAKVTPAIRLALTDGVRFHALGDLDTIFKGLAGQKVGVDLSNTVHALFLKMTATGIEVIAGKDPCELPKACKNLAEQEGMRAAHRRDGKALAAFLQWLQSHVLTESITEMDVEEKLLSFRQQQNLFVEPSFDTIAGYGPNGAVIHYRATPKTNRRLEAGNLFLLDSGGQYHDGTTDVTRTIAIGQPSAEHKDRFTRVLKGHIALATVVFPEGTTGAALDALARQYLWAAGFDYAHGTGHGVGSFLSVHEGPQGISSRAGDVALQPGMVVSNEPGYYKAGEYGIRIENLMMVRDVVVAGAEKKMLGFETLTRVPMDLSLVDLSLLTESEKIWLENYHKNLEE
jgi:Xaa-Pro aminopeptidase